MFISALERLPPEGVPEGVLRQNASFCAMALSPNQNSLINASGTESRQRRQRGVQPGAKGRREAARLIDLARGALQLFAKQKASGSAGSCSRFDSRLSATV